MTKTQPDSRGKGPQTWEPKKPKAGQENRIHTQCYFIHKFSEILNKNPQSNFEKTFNRNSEFPFRKFKVKRKYWAILIKTHGLIWHNVPTI
jgi:hypothetical protein